MPNLASLYYYSLSGNTKKGEYGRFNLSTKMKSILNASEGFFIDSGGCRKFAPDGRGEIYSITNERTRKTHYGRYGKNYCGEA